MTWAAQASRLLEAFRAELAACTADNDRGLERLQRAFLELDDHLWRTQRPHRKELEATLKCAWPLSNSCRAASPFD